jgi:hypothetical protein
MNLWRTFETLSVALDSKNKQINITDSLLSEKNIISRKIQKVTPPKKISS